MTNLSINKKKKVLIAVTLLLVGGNFVNIVQKIKGSREIDGNHKVYAGTEYRPTFTIPNSFDLAQSDRNKKIVDKKISDLELNKEHIRKIKKYFRMRGAPLANEAKTFEKMAVKYDLPYNLMPAIATIESGGGVHNYRPYNYAGMGGQSNAFVFNNYEEAIEKHAQILRFGYFDGGADTPEEIEKYYCYQCPTWGEKVSSVMYEIDRM
jgi:hypothetical protein